jgi:hypothetical protein
MPVYSVTRKSDGIEVHRYAAASVIEGAYTLVDFDHGELNEAGEPTVYSGPWTITKRSFWNRFPVNNEIALRAVINSGAPAILAASLQRLQVRVDASPYVDLRLPETMDGVMWLGSDGVPATAQVDGVPLPLRLTTQQVDAILNTEPTETEVWRG